MNMCSISVLGGGAGEAPRQLNHDKINPELSILAQRRVEIHSEDTVESLRARIQAEEHALLPVVVKRLAGQPLPLAL